jgi:hypothetical protein
MPSVVREPDATAAAPTAETPPEAAPQARACPRCQSPLAPEQDWCLQCGEAQPGRLAGLPGKRAAATVMALTTLIVGGAVAASYAALSDHPAPKPAQQLAQVPSTAMPPAATPAPVDPAASTPAPADTAPPAPADSGALPSTGSTPKTPAPSSGSSSTGSASRPSTGTSTGSSGTTTGSSPTGSSGSGSKSTPRTSTTPADTPPAAIALAGGAAALYDPYTRDTAAGDAAKALDGNPATSFPITVADGATTVGAGLVVDLGKNRGVRELDLTTKTPGFKLELYATDSADLPPDVLDTRWAHIKDVSDVGTAADHKQIITLGSGTTKYRHVLLWFTAPPKDGLTVRVSELKLLG